MTIQIQSNPDTSPTVSPRDPRNVTAVATGLTSLAIWAVTHYLSSDPQVTAAVAVVVPAVVAWAGAHLAFKTSPPRVETPVLPTRTSHSQVRIVAGGGWNAHGTGGASSGPSGGAGTTIAGSSGTTPGSAGSGPGGGAA